MRVAIHNGLDHGGNKPLKLCCILHTVVDRVARLLDRGVQVVGDVPLDICKLGAQTIKFGLQTLDSVGGCLYSQLKVVHVSLKLDLDAAGHLRHNPGKPLVEEYVLSCG